MVILRRGGGVERRLFGVSLILEQLRTSQVLCFYRRSKLWRSIGPKKLQHLIDCVMKRVNISFFKFDIKTRKQMLNTGE